MKKAVVYDLDGTLLNTLTTISEYCNETMEHFGLSTFPVDDYRYFVGNGARVLIERLLEQNGVSYDEYFEKTFDYYNSAYNSAPLRDTIPYDGICELVANLKDRGIKQAVLSNKPDFAVKSNVEHFFEKTFDRVYGARDGVPLKPDPAMLTELLKELDVSAEECIYVGDTDIDMKTGRSVGAFTVGVLWGFRDESELTASGADKIVSSPLEILEFI